MRAARDLAAPWSQVANSIAGLLGAFLIYAVLMTPPRYIVLSVYIGGTLILIFIFYGARRSSPADRPSSIDVLWLAASAAPTIYYSYNFTSMHLTAGLDRPVMMALGVILVVACLEAARRVLGLVLPAVAILSIVYALYGESMPGLLQHAGISSRRMVDSLYSSEGVYGILARTFATFVVPFMIFAAFLERMGSGQAFVRLAMRVVGARVGGAAKASVVSSALAGSVIGSGAGNIAVTGTFTIPLMKRTGARPHEAAAIETVASLGGNLVPPVMGATVFVMASMTGIPYAEIVIVSVVPALLLYLSLYAQVHLRAKKNGWTATEEPPTAGGRAAGSLAADLVLLIPVLVLIAMILMAYSPFMAAIAGMIAAVGVSMWQPRERRLWPRAVVRAIASGMRGTIVVGATAGVMGVLVSSLTVTGTVNQAASWIVHLSNGRLALAVLFVFVASYILGMGLTVVAAYIMIAVVAVPALVELGVSPLAAHLVIIWFSIDSGFTPPFALGAFVGAGLAQADPMKTAWTSTWLGKAIYLMPIMMIWTPILPTNGLTIEFVRTAGAAALGVIALAAAFTNFFASKLRWWELIALAAGGVALIVPEPSVQAVGVLAVCGAFLANSKRTSARHSVREQVAPLGSVQEGG